MLSVYHWNTQQVVLGDNACHLFLVSVRLHFDDIFVHQVLQTSACFRYHKLAQ